MSHATFSAPDMTTYCGLEELGLVAVGMRCQGGGFVLKCRAANPARLCPGCGRPGYSLGSRTRRLAHEPRGHQPTTLAHVGVYTEHIDSVLMWSPLQANQLGWILPTVIAAAIGACVDVAVMRRSAASSQLV